MSTKGYTVLGWIVWQFVFGGRSGRSSRTGRKLGAIGVIALVFAAGARGGEVRLRRRRLALEVATTERLVLRSWAPEDLESAHAYQSDPEVWRFIGDPSRTLDDTRERLERGTAVGRTRTRLHAVGGGRARERRARGRLRPHPARGQGS